MGASSTAMAGCRPARAILRAIRKLDRTQLRAALAPGDLSITRGSDASEASHDEISMVGANTDTELHREPVGNTLAVLGLSWATGEPELRVRGGALERSTLVPLRQLELSYRTTGRRFCLGRAPVVGPGRQPGSSRTPLDCDRPPVEGGRRCDRCTAAEAAFAASLHHAHTREFSMIDASVREHLMQTNLLYLAGFRDGSIKVGTTTEVRAAQRLAEQGAWQAGIVAVADDGIAVRQLEDLVTELLGIPQSVSIQRKLDGLAVSNSTEAAERDARLEQVVSSHAARVRQIIDTAQDPRLTTHDRQWRHPSHAGAHWDRVHRYPQRLDHGPHRLQILDACGRAIALRRPGGDDVFVADLGQLFGRELEVGDHGATEITIQDRLF